MRFWISTRVEVCVLILIAKVCLKTLFALNEA